MFRVHNKKVDKILKFLLHAYIIPPFSHSINFKWTKEFMQKNRIMILLKYLNILYMIFSVVENINYLQRELYDNIFYYSQLYKYFGFKYLIVYRISSNHFPAMIFKCFFCGIFNVKNT
jgi:hypothetical protein